MERLVLFFVLFAMPLSATATAMERTSGLCGKVFSNRATAVSNCARARLGVIDAYNIDIVFGDDRSKFLGSICDCEQPYRRPRALSIQKSPTLCLRGEGSTTCRMM